MLRAACAAMLASVENGLDRELEQAQAALLARFAPDTRVRRIRWSQGETRLFELGSGPPLLYVHGGLGGAYEVVPILAALAQAHRVLAVDRPGHGLADPFDYRGVDLLDHELPEELPAPVPRRVREQVPAKSMADERESQRKHLEGRPLHDPERRADERKVRHAAGSVEREGDGQERAQRVGDHIDGRELERVNDVAQERPTVVEQVDAAIVERIGQPMAWPVHGEHPVGLRERREDRRQLVCAA